jgi:hypothetical protein
MPGLTPAKLRALSRQFREAGQKVQEAEIKRLFAEEALRLAQEAEALERKNRDQQKNR